MKLQPIDNSNLELVAAWLADEANYQWLDFGNGSQRLTPVSLKIMTQKNDHVLRLFTPESGETPIGLVALSQVNRPFKTALLWYVLGEKSYAGQGYTTQAVSKILTLGFGELGLQAVNAWVVEQNTSSLRVLERNHFRLIGRQRQCHYIDGRPRDRLLLDLVASEHQEL